MAQRRQALWRARKRLHRRSAREEGGVERFTRSRGGRGEEFLAPRARSFFPGPPLALPESRLKWYDLARAEIPPPDRVVAEAREFLAREYAEGRLAIAGDLGFVILHRCSETFYFLIVSTWRNENELWETVYAKSDVGPFAVFPLPGPHRGTYCVWELGPVWHERQAWRRYLASARDDAAKRAYLDDRCAGPV